jgi:prepilin-type N-terminal cleavage/methylation domain-containing protein
MNKLNAYTLTELVVAMLISGIVVSITYTCFGLLSGQFRAFKRNAETVNQLVLLDALLTRDVNACDYLVRTQTGIACHYAARTIAYTFGDGYVCRRDGAVTDTLAFAPSRLETEFRRLPEGLPGNLIDRVAFRGLSGEDEHVFLYRKHYGADRLMEPVPPVQLHDPHGGTRPE